MKLTSPVIMANVLGATVFLVIGIVFLCLSSGGDHWNLEAAKFFGMLFGALAIATSIALTK